MDSTDVEWSAGWQRFRALGLKRRMTRTNAVLWTVIVTATAADVVLTMVGTDAGLREGNAAVTVAVTGYNATLVAGTAG